MNELCDCSPQPGASTRETNAALKRVPCPTNQIVGKVVDTLTLKALLTLPLTQLHSSANYYFCSASDCPTIYYSADGMQLFQETDVREKVYQKHQDELDVLVCYCFQHTVGSIQAEIAQTGQSTVIEQINHGIQAGLCACDIRNPQGKCCLGNVRTLVRQFEKAKA